MIRNCDCHCNMASWIKSPWIEELLATGSLETPLTRTLRGQVLEVSEYSGFAATRPGLLLSIAVLAYCNCSEFQSDIPT